MDERVAAALSTTLAVASERLAEEYEGYLRRQQLQIMRQRLAETEARVEHHALGRDAAALAGASAFLEYQESQAQQAASQRAVEYATSNEIRNWTITSDEVSVWVNLDSATVRAAVRRADVPTWFARIFGISTVAVKAFATAEAAAGTAHLEEIFLKVTGGEAMADVLEGLREAIEE